MGDELQRSGSSNIEEYSSISKNFIIERHSYPRCLRRIRRLSIQALEANREKFGKDFKANKEALGTVAIIRSKQLRNEIAGYITRMMREEDREERTISLPREDV